MGHNPYEYEDRQEEQAAVRKKKEDRGRRAFSASVFCMTGGGPTLQVLLIRHKLLNLWLPVGGELEDGETPLEAATREVREETGFEPVFQPIRYSPDGTPPGFIGYEEHTAGPKGTHLNFCFAAFVNSREPVSDGSWDKHVWVNPITFVGGGRFPCPKNVEDVMFKIAQTTFEVP